MSKKPTSRQRQKPTLKPPIPTPSLDQATQHSQPKESDNSVQAKSQVIRDGCQSSTVKMQVTGENSAGFMTNAWRLLTPGERVASMLGIFGFLLTSGSLILLWQQTNVMSDQNELLKRQLLLDQRPWIKVGHRIIRPLTFDVGGRASGKPVAMATVEDKFENIGKTVALNVISWEDIIPMDLDGSTRTALARQKEWCDANRHQRSSNITGYALFPGEPMIQNSTIGPTMETVAKSIIQHGESKDRVALVLVGCVSYKAPFEGPQEPSHQTRFMYFLASQDDAGLTAPYIFPRGIADQLRLITYPFGLTAD